MRKNRNPGRQSLEIDGSVRPIHIGRCISIEIPYVSESEDAKSFILLHENEIFENEMSEGLRRTRSTPASRRHSG